VNEAPQVVDLLTQIRDLLIPIESHYHQEYEDKVKQQSQTMQLLLAKKVTGAQSRKAILLMDGTRTQAEISKASGVSSGNLSRLVRELGDAHLLKDESLPTLKLTISEAQAAFAGKSK
jgi:hypothetical protein